MVTTRSRTRSGPSQVIDHPPSQSNRRDVRPVIPAIPRFNFKYAVLALLVTLAGLHIALRSASDNPLDIEAPVATTERHSMPAAQFPEAPASHHKEHVAHTHTHAPPPEIVESTTKPAHVVKEHAHAHDVRRDEENTSSVLPALRHQASHMPSLSEILIPTWAALATIACLFMAFRKPSTKPSVHREHLQQTPAPSTPAASKDISPLPSTAPPTPTPSQEPSKAESPSTPVLGDRASLKSPTTGWRTPHPWPMPASVSEEGQPEGTGSGPRKLDFGGDEGKDAEERENQRRVEAQKEKEMRELVDDLRAVKAETERLLGVESRLKAEQEAEADKMVALENELHLVRMENARLKGLEREVQEEGHKVKELQTALRGAKAEVDRLAHVERELHAVRAENVRLHQQFLVAMEPREELLRRESGPSFMPSFVEFE